MVPKYNTKRHQKSRIENLELVGVDNVNSKQGLSLAGYDETDHTVRKSIQARTSVCALVSHTLVSA